LIDENTLLFIYDLLTDTSFSSKNRQQRLQEIIDNLNETHQRVVNQTVSRLLYEINRAAAATAATAATAAHYLPDGLRVLHSSYPEPETEFKISVAQLSSTPIYHSMSCRYFLGGLSVVGTSEDDTFKCEATQTVITKTSLIPLVESLAFTISFRVDMRYKGDDYLFSFKLDRDLLNPKIDVVGGKCVFKHSDIIQHIMSESFKSCVISALDKEAPQDPEKRIESTIKGINALWPERTIDLIFDGCAVIDRCFRLPPVPFTPSRLDLVFHSKVEGSSGSLILRPNPRDDLTKRSMATLFTSETPVDPVVNVHVHFSEIDDVLSAFLSKRPFGDTFVKWIDMVNEYDESISKTLLQFDQGNDFSSVLSSVSRSLSQRPSLSRSLSSSRGTEAHGAPSKVRDTSVEPPLTRRLSLDNVRLHEKEEEQPMKESMLQQFIDGLPPDGKTTQIPPSVCESGGGGASAPVGYYTRFKSAFKEWITFLFSRPTRQGKDDGADMGGGHRLQKNTNITIRRRHNKKQSRKKYRYRIKQVKTKQRNNRKRTTYKK